MRDRGSFPNGASVLKHLCLALARFEQAWERSIGDRNSMFGRLSILFDGFDGRIPAP